MMTMLSAQLLFLLRTFHAYTHCWVRYINIASMLLLLIQCFKGILILILLPIS